MICEFCKDRIFTDKERYVHVEDYNKEKKEKDIWCHLKCFKKAMNRELTQMEKQSMGLLNQAQKLFGKIEKAFPGGKDDGLEVVQI